MPWLRRVKKASDMGQAATKVEDSLESRQPSGKNAERADAVRAGVRKFLIGSWMWFAILLGWFLITNLFHVRPVILPPIRDVISSFVRLSGSLPKALGISLYMTIVGFVIGTALGVGTSLIMAYSKFFRDSFSSIFDFVRPVPIFALIPLFILWFGIGRVPQIALILVGVSVIIGVVTLDAIRNIPKIYIDAAYTLGARKKQIFSTIILPSIFPHIIGSIRVGAATAFGLDVAAEFMGSQEGLGYLMIVQQNYLRTDGIIAIVLIYSVLAFVVDRILCVVERRLTYWTERRVHGKEEFMFYE
jgi:ABC-type nitrate/sulfonate/bicarbonate transport system permease component